MEFVNVKFDNKRRVISFDTQEEGKTFSWAVQYQNGNIDNYRLIRTYRYHDSREDIDIAEKWTFRNDGYPLDYVRSSDFNNGSSEIVFDERHYSVNDDKGQSEVQLKWTIGAPIQDQLNGASRSINQEELKAIMLKPKELHQVQNFIISERVRNELGLKPEDPITPAGLYMDQTEGRRPENLSIINQPNVESDGDSDHIERESDEKSDQGQKRLDFDEGEDVGRPRIS